MIHILLEVCPIIVLLACRWCHSMKTGSVVFFFFFLFFSGIRTSTAKKPYIFVIFKTGAPDSLPHLDPSMSPNVGDQLS